MNSWIEYTLLGVLYTECCAGILVNLIILAATFLKWKTLRSLKTYYKILGCLVMSRSLYVLIMFYLYILYVFCPWVLLEFNVAVATRMMTIFLDGTNLWFATILCIFYCVKITNYNWKIFIFLKKKLSTVVPWLLLASLIISVSCSLSFRFYILNLETNNLSNSAMENLTVYNTAPILNVQKQFFLVLLGSSPPFLIFCVTTSLLLHSLWMHTRRMRSSGSGFRSPNFESHLSAVKSMSLFFALQMMYFIQMNVFFSGCLPQTLVWGLFSVIVACSPSFFHSLYIICSNSDLKKTCISMFHVLTRGVLC